MSKIIHLISGPRNISTALMYSFGNRADCEIVDEPMYAAYLTNHQVEHPGREEILTQMDTDIEVVKQKVFSRRTEKPLVFVKNMAHHFIDIDHRFIFDHHNILLIREPKQLITSFAKVIANPTIQDIGIEKEYLLFLELQSKGKHPTVVVDSNEILSNPEGILKEICRRIDIPFSERMLSWEAGPRKEDGVWAKYWYANVHKSTGFEKQRATERELPKRLEPLYQKAKYFYDVLFEHSIKA